MKATTKGVVLAHADLTIPNGVNRHVVLLGWDNVCIPLVVWRDQVPIAARIAEESLDKVICVNKVKYMKFRDEDQLEVMNDTCITPCA